MQARRRTLTDMLSNKQFRKRVAILAGAVLAITLLALTTDVAFAQDGGPPGYRDFPIIGSRVAIWISAQVHLMFAAFMLGVPMFAVVVEYVGMRTGEKRYDDLAPSPKTVSR